MTLTVFDFESHDVRFVGTFESPEWVALDVCAVLGIKNTSDALGRLRPKQKGSIAITDTSSSSRKTITVATVKESGLYKLILTSRKKEVAERFEDWVFDEVLPSIRKKGYYISPAQQQRHEQARLQGKFARRTLTDAIQAYIKRHPKLSKSAKKWMYKNATDELYRRVYGKAAKKLVEAIGCDKRHLRDSLSIEELVVISSIEDTAVRLIDQNILPKSAMLQSAGRVMALNLFVDRHALPEAS